LRHFGFMKANAYQDRIPQGRTSMLQGVEATKTEVEVFAGKMVELGRRRRIPTPVKQTLLSIIHVLEQEPASNKTDRPARMSWP
jgi:ketopantoate reductase